MAQILIVDDEPRIVELARLYLENSGHSTLNAHTGTQALRLIEEHHPDLVVLDIMLPELDGWEVCRLLRQEGDSTPIIMLTARTEDVDRIVGLELGADDYMTKPFNPSELVARVNAVLRRAAIQQPIRSLLRVGQLELDRQGHEARIRGEKLELRAKEFDLLRTFAEHPGLVFNRDQLLERVWGYSFAGGTRTVDVHVARLRHKLRNSGLRIETIWNVGYKLVEE